MTKKLLGYSLLAMMLTACVTINIYFPAAAAEEAARTIVRDVLQKEGALERTPPADNGGKGDKQSRHLSTPNTFLVAFGTLLEAVVPVAHAGQANININTAAIRAIRASMEGRQSRLAPFYRAGAVGFDQQGMVGIRNLGAVSLKDRNSLKQLVAEENADRAKLYREIAAANGHPEWEADVRGTFAKVWQQEALPGYWIQDGGVWRQR